MMKPNQRRLLGVALSVAACTDAPSPLRTRAEDEILSLPLEPALAMEAVDLHAHRHLTRNQLLDLDALGAHVRRPGGDVTLRTASLGREGGRRAVALDAPVEGPCLDGGLTCVRPSARVGDGVVEWWVARPYGAQHAWRVDARPAGEGELTLEVAVDGARVSADGDAAVFTPEAGPRLFYRELKAWDADGRALPARFETDGATLDIRVDDTDAVWPITIDPILTTGSHRVAPGGSLLEFGTSVAAGLINNDSYMDIAVGERRATQGPGRIYVFHGRSDGTYSSTPTATINAGGNYNCSDSRAGSYIDVMDVSGDGRADVMYTMPAAPCQGVGAIALHLGSNAGITASPSRIWDGGYGTTGPVVGIGDVNNDNINDLAFTDSGQIKVIHGASGGPGAAITRTIAPPAGASYFWLGGAVDINNDGYDDIIGGLPGMAGGGGAHLFKGASGGLPASPSQTLSVPSGSSEFGHGVRGVGDINNDGRGDMWVGDPGWSSGNGRSFVYYGSTSTLNTTPTTLDVNTQGIREGQFGFGIGDLENDGPDDLLVFCREQTNIQHTLWEGTSSGLSASPSNSFMNGYFSADALGDFDGDGFGDYVAGEFQDNEVWVHYGCRDADNDGTCADAGDCDDNNAAREPGNTEIVGNGVDENCDGQESCYDDDDNDGYLDSSGDTRTSTDTDCNDTNEGTNTDPTNDCADTVAARNPGATEITANGVDENCDGLETCYDDDDNDGYLDTSGDTRSSADADCADTNEGWDSDPTTDCDDALAARNPGATEITGNGIDENCNGQEVCFDDDDNDGFLDTSGDTRASTDLDCTDANEGLNNDPTTDCDDNAAGRNPNATEITGNGIDENCNGQETCFEDDDNDGYLDASGDTRNSLDVDCLDANEGTNTDLTTDCDDGAAARNPGATEITGNGIDEDCNNQEVCFDDDDNDGFLDNTGDTRASTDADCADANEGTNTDQTTDCDDAAAGRNPNVTEITGNGIDENCNGQETCFDDDDNDGYLDNTGDTRNSLDVDCLDANEGTSSDLTTDCDDTAAGRNPGATEITGNGIDEDCNNQEVCFDDDDNDGFLDTSGDTRTSTDADCADANEGANTDLTTDCDDAAASRNPNATEITGNGIDENCNGQETCFDDDDDDGFLDASGDTRNSLDADCLDANEGTSSDLTTDCDDAVASRNPNAAEITGNGIDENCNGQETCFDDDDNDGFLDASGDTRSSLDTDCLDANEGTNADLTTDCDDNAASRNPSATEITGNGIDETCDGREVCFDDDDDDGFLDTSADTRASTDADCADANEGTSSDLTTDCDDTRATVRPGATEATGDNLDANCDGQEICWVDGDRDGWHSDRTQTSPVISCNVAGLTNDAAPGGDCDDGNAAVNPGAVEDPGNGIDDDCTEGTVCAVDVDDDGAAPLGLTVESADDDCADPGEVLPGAPVDCDDAVPTVFTGATEVVADEVDQNCDGQEICFDDDDDDGFLDDEGDTRVSSDADCADENEAADDALTTDCADEDGAIFPGAVEVAGDEVDQDCDGAELCFVDGDDDGFVIGDGATATSADADCADPTEALAGAATGDCDDAAAAIRPDATESPADGVDQDCDAAELCWVDGDGDGQTADAGVLVLSSSLTCAAPGVVGSALTLDCDDTNPARYQGATEDTADGLDADCDGLEACFADADEDGWRTDELVLAADLSCTAAGLAVTSVPSGDCDDTAAAVNPGQTEDPTNGIDDDCQQGLVCGSDLDGDGAATGTVVSDDDDCDDDGEVLADAPTDCDDGDALVFPGAEEGPGDEVDQDCDGGELCFFDADADAFLADAPQTVVSADVACDGPNEALATAFVGDCDDTTASVFPGAAEAVGDGIDQDCDGGDLCLIDGDGDGYRVDGAGSVASADLDCADAGEAAPSAPAGDCDDADAAFSPAATELPGDGVDQDCDSREACFEDSDDDGFLDGTGRTRLSDDLDCADALEAAAGDAVGDCDDSDAAVRPGATESVGNGVDEDCDGGERCYADADRDGFAGDAVDALVASADADCADPGEATATAPRTDCADDNDAIRPDAQELPGDGVDQDCDTEELCWVDDDRDGQTGDAATLVTSASLTCDDGLVGVPTPVDCDDNDAARFVGATERVNDQVDQNCDGLELCYVDNDGDRYGGTGTREVASLVCDAAGVTSGPPTDCDDNNAAAYPGATDNPGTAFAEDCSGTVSCRADADGDGFADPVVTVLSADRDCADPGEADPAAGTDCDDTNPAAFPGGQEQPDDGADGDCDGEELCYVDADGDGFAIDALVNSFDLACDGLGEATAAAPRTDCDDTEARISPAQTEGPANGIDQDCDGQELCFIDADDDGWRAAEGTVASGDLSCNGPGLSADALQEPDCDDDDAAVSPGGTEQVGDGVDSDCDGAERCYADGDEDGWRTSQVVVSVDADCLDGGEAVAADPEPDCDDADGQRYPGAAEVLGDGLDQDCDGSDAQASCFADRDGDGFRTDTLVGSADADCTDPGEASGDLPGGDCDDQAAGVYPGAPEIPADGVDEDCDGAELCFADADDDGFSTSTLVSSVVLACAEATDEGDCDDSASAVFPGATEGVGDGVDQDCDGEELCLVDGDDDGLVLAGAATVGSGDLDCEDAGEAAADALAEDCDDSSADADADALSDFDEVTEHGTDPCEADSDDDGLQDSDELTRGTDPLDADSDDGSVSDGEEVENRTDPLDGSDDVEEDIIPGGEDKDDTDPEGCSCATGSTGSGAWLVLAAIGLLRRRRVA